VAETLAYGSFSPSESTLAERAIHTVRPRPQRTSCGNRPEHPASSFAIRLIRGWLADSVTSRLASASRSPSARRECERIPASQPIRDFRVFP